MNLSTVARLLGASMRLTRLVIHDELGERLIQKPMDALVVAHSSVRQVPNHHPDYVLEMEDRTAPDGSVPIHTAYGFHDEPQYPDWLWLRDGLTCPACIGFWITLVVTCIQFSPLGGSVAWKVVTTALALNEAALRIPTPQGDPDQQDTTPQ